MAWIGITDHLSGWFCPRGDGAGPGGFLARGTLMVEARLAPDARPRTLLAFQRAHPCPGRLALQLLPGGSVVFVEARGDDTRSAVLPCPYDDRADIVRLSYSWDAPAGRGRLAVERSQPGACHSVDLGDISPVPGDDLRAVMRPGGPRQMDTDVIFAALSDAVEPIGPMPGLTAHTPILTHLGERPVALLKRGDVVITDSGARVPVLQVVRRTVPARGSFRPIRLRAGYFGLTRDIVVAPHQKLVMRGSDVEYMFGSEAVLVPARHLLNNLSATWANGPGMVTYHQVLLPGHEVIRAAGAALTSLFVGRLRRNPGALAASVLAGLPRARLPEHAQPAWPVLRPFEAITLASSRAA